MAGIAAEHIPPGMVGSKAWLEAKAAEMTPQAAEPAGAVAEPEQTTPLGQRGLPPGLQAAVRARAEPEAEPERQATALEKVRAERGWSPPSPHSRQPAPPGATQPPPAASLAEPSSETNCGCAISRPHPGLCFA